jgi:hypothetical protein
MAIADNFKAIKAGVDRLNGVTPEPEVLTLHNMVWVKTAPVIIQRIREHKPVTVHLDRIEASCRAQAECAETTWANILNGSAYNLCEIMEKDASLEDHG